MKVEGRIDAIASFVEFEGGGKRFRTWGKHFSSQRVRWLRVGRKKVRRIGEKVKVAFRVGTGGEGGGNGEEAYYFDIDKK